MKVFYIISLPLDTCVIDLSSTVLVSVLFVKASLP